MNLTILDDYFDTLRGLPCFRKLDGHAVTVWNDHVQDVDALAERLRDTEALVLIRERTQIRAPLIARLPKLRLISQRSVYPHIDVDACTAHGVILSSNQHAGTPSYAAAELTWGLVLAGMRRIPQQVEALKNGVWQTGMGRTLRGRTRYLRLWPDRRRSGALWRGVRHAGAGVGARGVTPTGARRRLGCGAGQAGVLRGLRRALAAHAAGAGYARHRHGGRSGAHEAIGAVGEYQPRRPDRAGRVGAGAARGPPRHGGGGRVRNRTLRDPKDPLLQLPNAICTPHIGYVTEDEYETQFSDVFDQIVSYAAGKPIHVINPAVLA